MTTRSSVGLSVLPKNTWHMGRQGRNQSTSVPPPPLMSKVCSSFWENLLFFTFGNLSCGQFNFWISFFWEDLFFSRVLPNLGAHFSPTPLKHFDDCHYQAFADHPPDGQHTTCWKSFWCGSQREVYDLDIFCMPCSSLPIFIPQTPRIDPKTVVIKA